MIRDHGKFVLFALVLVMMGALRAIDAVDVATFRGVLLLIVGYLVGNGVQAVRGKAPSPVFVPTAARAGESAASDLAPLAAALAPIVADAIAAQVTAAAAEAA